MCGNDPRSRRNGCAFARRLLVPALLAAALPAAAWAQGGGGRDIPVFTGNLDVRVNATAELSKVLPAGAKSLTAKAAEKSRAMGRAAAALAVEVPGAEVQFSEITGAPEVVRGSRPLTVAAPGRSATDVALGFVQSHLALYGLSADDAKGLRPVGESVSRRNGLRMVRVEQTVNGVPVFQSETRFLIDSQGQLVRSVGLIIPDATADAPPLTGLMSPEEALAAAVKASGFDLQPGTARAKDASPTRATLTSADPLIAGAVDSWVVYFPAAPGVLVPAWAQIIFTTGDADWYSVVDARTGTLLWRKNIRDKASTQDARFSVYVQADGITPADSPAPMSPSTVTPGSGTQAAHIPRVTVSMFAAQDLTASPDGWIPDGGTTTVGNNVDACVDRVVSAGEANVCDVGTVDNNGRPVGNPDGNGLNRDFFGTTPRDYTYSPAPAGTNPDAGDDPTGVGVTQVNFRRGSVTQLFYITNWFHDQLYNLGFDEAAGNFQTTNYSGMGAGNDPVRADAQDGSSTNNATFSTPPDGTSGRMSMFRFTSPTPDRDGGLDNEISIHELGHGVSNRLIGNATGLNWDPGRGMGEGWSDFYALSLLNNTNADDPDAPYASGAYATYRLLGFPLTDNYLYGIRRFPYSTDNTVNPLTWADVDSVTINMSGGIAPSPVPFNSGGAFEVHNTGEIWALSLWEMRSRIIADPAGANGDVPTGNLTALQLVTDALKMTPINPSFVDARDALFDADCATNACANEQWIWEGFADRGLGYDAVFPLGKIGASRAGQGGAGTLGESFTLPYLDPTTIAVDDSLGNNNGALDPGEPIRLTVTLTNPWRAASKSVAAVAATLTSSTPGVVILDNASAYGAIAPQGSAAGDTFLITVAPTVTCGSTIHFTLQTVSTLGTTSTNFTLRAGAPSGTGAPITYSRANVGLAIPDGNRLGASDALAITDDFEIADLDVQIDSLTHGWSGDLTFLVRGPSGYGTTLSIRRGVFFGVANSAGANFTNTRFDDDLALTAENDLNQTVPADAPFTGSWLPAFNSPLWDLFGLANFTVDTVGQLSRFDGGSTQGTWNLHLFDAATPDAGTLNGWSLIVTPRAFSCVAFAPAPLISATKTVSGTFTEGGTVTYTITITNTGSGTQDDNAGHEFTDTLPAGLTLVSANATAGSATTSGNTVNWDGSLSAVIGSVTITVTATVNAGTNGTTISNQGTFTADSNLDGTNDLAVLTDDPATQPANDPTVFQVAAGAVLTATKVVSGGDGAEGGTVEYTIVITNSGGPQADNAGAELTDVLPASLTLVSASATSGTVVANVATNTVTWNGAIPSAGTVTITIQATIDPDTFNTVISNQALLSFDSNGDLINDAPGGSDDPATGPSADPTSFVVGASSVVQIPTVSEWGAMLLALLLAVFALRHLRFGA